MRATTSAILLVLCGVIADAAASTASADDATADDIAEPDHEASTDDEGDEGFCGGDEDEGDTLIWQAEDSLAEGDARDAARNVLAALDDGRIHGAQRARAWQVVGEARLRMGQFRRAERAYLRSFALSEPSDDDPARIGLAMARLGRRERSMARDEATDFVAAACEGDTPQNVAACYGAHLLLASLATDGDSVHTAQMERVRSLRTSSTDEASLASMDALVATVQSQPSAGFNR